MMKEKLEVKLATPEFLPQGCICSEYVAPPSLSTSSGVNWIIETEFVAFHVELETEKQKKSSERVRDREVFRKSKGVNRMREKK